MGLGGRRIEQTDATFDRLDAPFESTRPRNRFGGLRYLGGSQRRRVVCLEEIPMSDYSYAQYQSAITTIDAGDAYLAAFKYENATHAYQVAGTQSQSILAAGANASADALDQQLQALQSNLASQATAEQAQSLAKQIVTIYTPLVAAIPVTPGTSAIVVAPPASPATSSSSSTTIAKWVLGGIAAAGIVGIFYLMIRGPEMFENPSSGSAGPRRVGGKKALIKKGRACHFIMKEGRGYHAGGSMLHDPSGRWWPRNSVLCGPFKRQATKSDVEMTTEGRHYLGKRQAVAYVIDTPSKALGGWQYLGEIEEIRYTRTGRKKPGRYYHVYNKPGALFTMLKGKGKARLYRLGRYYRVELPRSAVLDARGFVYP
jgi:hypothetical protein